MQVTTRILTLALIAGTSLLASTGAGAWWSDRGDDYWDGPWGYPGYGWGGYPGYGWGGYPGSGGWDGYPGYGRGGHPGYGWGSGVPRVIYVEPRGSGNPPPRRIE